MDKFTNMLGKPANFSRCHRLWQLLISVFSLDGALSLYTASVNHDPYPHIPNEASFSAHRVEVVKKDSLALD